MSADPKISGFTFLRNAAQLGFPFIQSIQSILPICDEFVVNVGKSNDDTLEQIRALDHPKIKIIESEWNDKMRHKGFVYGQQKMMAQYHCTGDWLFYLEADEVVHENDLPKIKAAMERYHNDPKVEALAFDYYHFYGNTNTIAWSPVWYRREARIIKSSVRSYAPDGLFWVVLDKSNKKGRYPRAAMTGAYMYHYGWVRPEEIMQNKLEQVKHFWDQQKAAKVDYRKIDSQILRKFSGTHPAVLNGFFPKTASLYKASKRHT